MLYPDNMNFNFFLPYNLRGTLNPGKMMTTAAMVRRRASGAKVESPG